MKKLLLIFAAIIISINSMGMGFPQNTYTQQRTISKTEKKSVISLPVQIVETSIENDLESKLEVNSSQRSVVEMLANYIVSLFTEKLFQNKALAIETFQKSSLECFAIKNDCDYQFIG